MGSPKFKFSLQQTNQKLPWTSKGYNRINYGIFCAGATSILQNSSTKFSLRSTTENNLRILLWRFSPFKNLRRKFVINRQAGSFSPSLFCLMAKNNLRCSPTQVVFRQNDVAFRWNFWNIRYFLNILASFCCKLQKLCRHFTKDNQEKKKIISGEFLQSQ